MSNKRMGCLAVVLLAALAIIIAIVAVPARGYEGERITTARQDELHRIADNLRLAGLSEDDPALQALSAEWWAQEEALNIIAKVVRYEADPQWCEWEHSVAVAAVVINRVNSPYFPNSVKAVLPLPVSTLKLIREISAKHRGCVMRSPKRRWTETTMSLRTAIGRTARFRE